MSSIWESELWALFPFAFNAPTTPVCVWRQVYSAHPYSRAPVCVDVCFHIRAARCCQRLLCLIMYGDITQTVSSIVAEYFFTQLLFSCQVNVLSLTSWEMVAFSIPYKHLCRFEMSYVAWNCLRKQALLCVRPVNVTDMRFSILQMAYRKDIRERWVVYIKMDNVQEYFFNLFTSALQYCTLR